MKKYLILFAVLAAMLMTSCGGTPETEIAAALAELIPASLELNVVYFGEGLPISSDRETAEAFYESMGAGAEISLNYHPVSPEAPYQSIDEIKEATLAVFSESYADYLFTMAFEGLSTVFDEGTETQVTKNVSYARYLENEGIMTVRMNIHEEAFPLNRTYDPADFNEFGRVGIFTCAWGVSDRFPPKPAPDSSLAIADMLGLDPSEIAFVGDSDVDVNTARNAGMVGISVTWGYRTRAFHEGMGVVNLADTPEELDRLVHDPDIR